MTPTAAFVGWQFTGIGMVALLSGATLGVFFAAGDPYGTINDFENAAIGVGSGWLAWTLRRQLKTATGIAIAGAIVAVAGSALVISDTTGFLLAGLVSSVGFGLIGVWVIAFNRSSELAAGRPPWLSRLGIVAGALMVLGLATLPGVVLRLDDLNSAPGWI